MTNNTTYADLTQATAMTIRNIRWAFQTDQQTLKLVWAMFYANLMAMERHPGNLAYLRNGGAKTETFVTPADIADDMLDAFLKRFGDQHHASTNHRRPHSGRRNTRIRNTRRNKPTQRKPIKRKTAKRTT